MTLDPRWPLQDWKVPMLVRLRRRLTAWYVGTFAVILLAFALLLFWLIARQATRDLTHSLHGATNQIAHAAAIREQEQVTGANSADAVEELHIPDRELYLYDASGTLLTPGVDASHALRQTALQALREGPIQTQFAVGHNQTLEVYAEPLTLENGHRYVAVATANRLELEDRYATWIVIFVILAAVALTLVAIGGSVLARQATAPVERSIQSTRRFMAEAAHELRTPIAVLRSRTEVTLQRERDSATYASALTLISREAEQLGQVVDDLLLLARADIGERPLRRERVALDDILLDVVSAAGALSTSRGVRLEIGCADESPIDADPALMRQLVMILIDNAIKYTLPGGMVIADVSRQDEQITLMVRDTGQGIAVEELPRVFDRFYRGESARTNAGGAGLGLSIAQWIVDAHAARLSIESTLDVGTTVRVMFARMG